MKTEKGERVAVGYQPMAELERTAELSRLFAEHHQRVLRAAYRITGSLADAEDVAQAVFLRMASGGTEPMANPGSYLYRAAINGALDLLRRRKTAPSEPLEAAAAVACWRSDSSPEATISTQELGTWLRGAISNLSPRAAEMFTLRYLEGWDNREIAGVMSTSQAVVAVTLHTTRSKLKKLLQEYERGKR
jgi:RNA polymerase sigma factor (sigma-70 family)